MATHIKDHFEEYTRAVVPAEAPAILSCPVCSGKANLFQFTEVRGGPSSRVVMCSYSFGIGLQDGLVNEGCLLYMPPEDFYRATARDAIKYWNAFSEALVNLRFRNTRKSNKKNGALLDDQNNL